MTEKGAELLQAVKEMKAGKKGRVYTPEQLLAISSRQSDSQTKQKSARRRLLNYSFDIKVFDEVLAGSLVGAFSEMRAKCLEPLAPILQYAQRISHDFTRRRVAAALDLLPDERFPVLTET